MKNLPLIPPAYFETERLYLRQPQMDDAQVIFQSYAQDPEVTKYLIWKSHKSITETESFITRCFSVWIDGSAFPWAIVRKEDNRLLGMIEIRIEEFKIEMGYVLAKHAWNKGYTTEAAKAIIDWALEQKQIYRIGAVCDCENISSVRVLEKLGMKKEGVLKRWIILPNLSNEPRDCYSFALEK